VLGGTAHVPHGYTSCVMLPHVLRFNHPVNADRQRASARRSAIPANRRPMWSAADRRARFADRLRDVEVKAGTARPHRGAVDARPLDPHQPRKIDGPPVIRELLDAAW
jgi:alcohol dehydrogenase class IV